MNNRKKIFAIILTILVVVLGGVAVYVATRISTEKAVAPTAPESKPKAAGETWTPVISGCNLNLTVLAPTATPTPSPTPTATPTPSPSPTPTPTDTPLICNKTCGNNAQCPTGTFCSSGFCRNSSCPERNNCTCDDTALVCNKTCGDNSQCPSGTFCSSGFCRNPGCPTDQDCTCSVVTATPTRSGGVTATPTTRVATPTTAGQAVLPEGGEGTVTAAPTALPDAGISLPGIAVFGGGLLMAVIGIMLAL